MGESVNKRREWVGRVVSNKMNKTVVVEIEPLASHAVRNDGQRPLLIFAMTNGPYDPGHPDAYSRRVL